MSHTAHHALCALGLFRAGRSLDKRSQHAWLALAGLAALLCHRHHHRRSR